MTWTFLDAITYTHTESHFIYNEWKSSLLDVKARTRADDGSNNLLFMATLTIKLPKTRKKEQRARKIDANKLKAFQLKF